MWISLTRGCLILLVLSAITSPTIAQTFDADTDVDGIRAAFAAAAADVEIYGGPNGNSRLELQPEPILNWSNPERRTAAGGLFLWTLDGRPEVTMGAYPVSGSGFEREFQSLSLWPVAAREAGEVVWNPAGPGITMQPIAGLPAPAASPASRMLQLRRAARTFAAKLVPPKRTAIPLRLLASPLYRYPPTIQADDVIDGAIFAFVQGTDPEVLLLIEAVKEGESEGHWQFALARMSIVPTEVTQEGRLVWETQWAIQNRTTPYFVLKNWRREPSTGATD